MTLERRSICLIDDDELSCMLPKRILETQGYDVTVFHCPYDALDNLDKVTPDLILLDYLMPKMSGLELCEKIKANEKFRYIPVVIMTGEDEYECILKAYHIGANDFMIKPIDWMTFSFRIKYMIAAKCAMIDLDTAFQKIHLRERQLEVAQQMAKIGSWTYYKNSDQFQLTPEIKSLFGIKNSLIDADEFLQLISISERQFFKEKIAETLATAVPNIVHTKIYHALNDCYVNVDIAFEVAASLSEEGVIGVIQDVTKIKANEEKIQFLAYHDSLTNLPNRLHGESFFNSILTVINKDNDSIGVLFVDLNDFKMINDTYGHNIGDKFLVEVAERLRVVCASYQKLNQGAMDPLITRFGGDEFIIILPSVKDKKQVWQVTDRIMKAIAEPMSVGGIDISITCSVGISLYPEDGPDYDSLLRNADLAMYSAKSHVSNSYKFYEPKMFEQNKEQTVLEHELKKSIEKDELILFFQKQYCLTDKKINSAEVLLRWNHPRDGLVLPDKFIQSAEKIGYITEITHWVVRRVVTMLHTDMDRLKENTSIAINISPIDFLNEHFLDYLISMAEKYQVPTSMIDIEITESTIIKDINQVIHNMHCLAEKGFKLTIDDFGTGYSSFSYLQEFPIHKLKIDKKFIGDLFNKSKTESIIQAIIKMSHSLGVAVVAEGVETEQQYQRLKELGCDAIQGFFIDYPSPVQKISDIYTLKNRIRKKL